MMMVMMMIPTAQVWQTVYVYAHLSISRGVSDGIVEIERVDV